jgi:uncharacterized RmlC-like cupin family protein
MLPLQIPGQGVFVFDHVPHTPCSLTFKNENASCSIDITFMNGRVRVTAGLDPLIDSNNTQGLSTLPGAYYWFSVDSHNQMLYGGVGEPRLETVVYSYRMTGPEAKMYLKQLRFVDYGPGTLVPRKLMKDPVTNFLPLKVKDMDQITIADVATASHMHLANLTHVAQKMYHCIAGKKFVLDDESFPDFSKAIQRSIVTPGEWCYNKLLEKANEFGKPNPKETYLRITLGMNGGESPGIPYVMEIWPAGNYSPVHSHASADAVIRVLHGSIHVNLYPFLSENVKPFGVAEFGKGDITWISPMFNQTHQLKNITNDVCVTIQCYMYENKDKTHYDYFDYLDADGLIQQYEPDSDMDFMSFKRIMWKEWSDHNSEKAWSNSFLQA